MLIEHEGKSPSVHPTAYVAPNAVLCGNVTVGPDCRVLFGAVLTAESGPVQLGSHCIVMENAVIRGTAHHPVRLGDYVLVGPHAHLTGCTIGDSVFVATGAAVFNGAELESGCEVRINGVVHLSSRLPAEAVVPIGWVAVGDPAEILPPDAHERIWSIQEPLDFPKRVFGLKRESAGLLMQNMTRRYGGALGKYRGSTVLES